MSKKDFSHKKNALIIAIFLTLSCLFSIAYLLWPRDDTAYVADIFQDGTLVMSIPLNEVRENRIILMEGENGCVNEIEVRPGSIGIISADCPDKLCVRQGFIADSALPVTCLPNRLVIRLRPASAEGESPVPDAITY